MSLFRPGARYRRSWSGELVVVSPGEIPTVDFYLRPRAEAQTGCRVRYVSTLDAEELGFEPSEGAFVVVVRHAAPRLLRSIAAHSARWSGVAYLMDDDIPAAWRCRDVPFDYGLWTASRYLRIQHLLARVCDRIWVSTEELARRYAGLATEVVPPWPDARDYAISAPDCRRWGYHGTRVHKHELEWIAPLVAKVHATLDDVEFEVFGGRGVEELFRGIPRVKLVAPRPWQAYRAHCRCSPLALALAPLLPGRFNDARSHVKVFDVARCGAVGLFSDHGPYRRLESGPGLALLGDSYVEWATQVTRLFAQPELRGDYFRRCVEWFEDGARRRPLGELIG